LEMVILGGFEAEEVEVVVAVVTVVSSVVVVEVEFAESCFLTKSSFAVVSAKGNTETSRSARPGSVERRCSTTCSFKTNIPFSSLGSCSERMMYGMSLVAKCLSTMRSVSMVGCGEGDAVVGTGLCRRISPAETAPWRRK
jgi:hypothetical protein